MMTEQWVTNLQLVKSRLKNLGLRKLVFTHIFVHYKNERRTACRSHSETEGTTGGQRRRARCARVSMMSERACTRVYEASAAMIAFSAAEMSMSTPTTPTRRGAAGRSARCRCAWTARRSWRP